MKDFFGLTSRDRQYIYEEVFQLIHYGKGFTYNANEDIFVTPQPYASWIRSGSFWDAPTPCPQDNKNYFWDEKNLVWQELLS